MSKYIREEDGTIFEWKSITEPPTEEGYYLGRSNGREDTYRVVRFRKTTNWHEWLYGSKKDKTIKEWMPIPI